MTIWRPRKKRGRHYVPVKGAIGRPVEDIYERLKRYIVIDPINGCWLWTGKTDKDGYGRIAYNGGETSVHRLTAHLYRELPLDSPLLVCHKDICPNKGCSNPDHTFDGTYSDNNIRVLCNRGHDDWYVNPTNEYRYCKTCIANSPSVVNRPIVRSRRKRPGNSSRTGR